MSVDLRRPDFLPGIFPRPKERREFVSGVDGAPLCGHSLMFPTFNLALNEVTTATNLFPFEGHLAAIFSWPFIRLPDEMLLKSVCRAFRYTTIEMHVTVIV